MLKCWQCWCGSFFIFLSCSFFFSQKASAITISLFAWRTPKSIPLRRKWMLEQHLRVHAHALAITTDTYILLRYGLQTLSFQPALQWFEVHDSQPGLLLPFLLDVDENFLTAFIIQYLLQNGSYSMWGKLIQLGLSNVFSYNWLLVPQLPHNEIESSVWLVGLSTQKPVVQTGEYT